MLKKFQDLEELQSKLNGYCPKPQQAAYVHGQTEYLSKIVKNLLNKEYLDDLNRVMERHRPVGAAAVAAGVAAGAAFDPANLPPYDELR